MDTANAASASSRNALELVGELEFVWNQIKNNSPSSSASSKSHESPPRRFQQPTSGTDGPMRILSPMSEDDEAEHDYQRRIAAGEEDEQDGGGEYVKRGDKWSKKMERAIVKLSAEIAALREQITSGREWRTRREKTAGAWLGWAFWVAARHLAVDVLVLGLVLLWMRRRKDRRLEDQVRGALRVLREYARKVLPSR